MNNLAQYEQANAAQIASQQSSLSGLPGVSGKLFNFFLNKAKY